MRKSQKLGNQSPQARKVCPQILGNQKEKQTRFRNHSRTQGNSVNLRGRQSYVPYEIYQMSTNHSPNTHTRGNVRERQIPGLNHSNTQMVFEAGMGSIGKTKESRDKSVINVHQHFNHQNIMNFNHNDYFNKHLHNSDGQSPSLSQPNLLEEGLSNLSVFPQDQFDFLDESTQIQRGHRAIIANRRRIVSGILPSKKNNQSMLYRQLRPFIRASSTQNLQNHLFRRQERRNSLIKNLQGKQQSKLQKNKQALDKLNHILRSRRMTQLQSAKQGSVNDFTINDGHQVLVDNISQSTILAQLKADSTIQQHYGQPIIDDGSSQKSAENNEVILKLLTKGTQKSRQKYRGSQQYFTQGEKEAMQNELFLLKTQLNMFKENNTQLRTQNQTWVDKLKTKQKLIQELVAITEDQDQRINGNFTQLPQMHESQTLQKVRLIQQVNDLKQKLGEKNRELTLLQQDIKTTKIREIQQEIQIYQHECLRLRSIAEQAFNIISSHGLQKLFKKNHEMKCFMREATKNSSVGQLGIHKEEDVYQENKDKNNEQKLNQLQNELEDTAQKLNYSQQLVQQFEIKEKKWLKERTHLSLLLKQASSLQEQYQEKIKEQEQIIESQARKANKQTLKPRAEDKSVQTEQQDVQFLGTTSSMIVEHKTLQSEKNEAIKQVEMLQITIIQQNKDYIELQKQYQAAQKKKGEISLEEHAQLKIKLKKLQEVHDSTVESNKLLIENLRKTVQKLNTQLDECHKMNEQLFEEINLIKEKLLEKNIHIEDYEFSSESNLSISKLKNYKPITRIPQTGFQIQNIIREKTEVNNKKIESPVQIINEEELEEDDGAKEETVLLSPTSENDRIGLDMLQQDIMKKNIQKQRKSDAYLRANSHINPGMKKQDMLEKYSHNAQVLGNQDQQNDLLAAIDRINDGQTVSDIDNTSGIISQVTRMGLETRSIVLREDPNIQVALRRLARMQQIKRLNLDFIERELFDQEYKVSKRITIVDLASIFANKLGLTLLQANSFSRFLVEEIDESNHNQEHIQYNPRQKINFSMIVVRLMTYSLYPIIYRDTHEKEAKSKFRQAFSNPSKQAEFLELFDNERKLYDINEFYNNVDKCLGKGVVNDQTIDCMFIILCRGVNFNEIGKLSKKQLIDSYQGFYQQSLLKAFDVSSESCSLPLQDERIDTQHRSSSCSNHSFHKPRNVSATGMIKVLQLGDNQNNDQIKSNTETREKHFFSAQLSERNTNNQLNSPPKHQKFNHQKTSQTNDGSKPSLIDLAYSDPRSETDWDLQESRNDISPTMLQEFVRNQSNRTLLPKLEQQSYEVMSINSKAKVIQVEPDSSKEVLTQNQFILTREENESEEDLSPNFRKHADNFEREVSMHGDVKQIQIKADIPFLIHAQQTAETASEAEMVRHIAEQNIYQTDNNATFEKNVVYEGQLSMASFNIKSPVHRNNQQLNFGLKIKSFSVISQQDTNNMANTNFIKSNTKENILQYDDGKLESSAGFTIYERDKQSIESPRQIKLVKKPSQMDSFDQSNRMADVLSEIREKTPEMSQKGEFCLNQEKEESVSLVDEEDTETQNTPNLPMIPLSQVKMQDHVTIKNNSSYRLDEEKVNALRQFLMTEFNIKIEEQLKRTIDSKGITKIVGICVDVLVSFSYQLRQQLNQSIRAVFGPVIYQANPRLEVEIIRNSDVVSSIEKCLDVNLDESQRQALAIIWQNQNYIGFVQYSDITRALEVLGHYEPHVQYHNQSFRDLNAEAIRLLNKINKHLVQTKENVGKLLEHLSEVRKFRNKNGETKEILSVNVYSLFAYLELLGITKDKTVDYSFSQFMCFNKKLNQLIPIDKLANILEIASYDPYCLSYSTQPRFLSPDEQIKVMVSSETASLRSIEMVEDQLANFPQITNLNYRYSECISPSVPTQTYGEHEYQTSNMYSDTHRLTKTDNQKSSIQTLGDKQQ